MFSWDAPGATDSFSSSDMTRYEISVIKRNFQSQTSAEPRESVPPSTEEHTVSGPDDLKSITFVVRACTNEGCGVPASLAVAFRLDAAAFSSFFPSRLSYGVEINMFWAAVPLAARYELEYTRDGGAPSVIDTIDNRGVIVYGPDVQSISARVRACNGQVCGQYSAPLVIMYRAGVRIISGVGSFQATAGLVWSTVVIVNEPNVVYVVSADKPAWLNAYTNDINGVTNLIFSGTPSAGDVSAQPYNFTVTVEHANTNTTSVGTISLTVVN